MCPFNTKTQNIKLRLHNILFLRGVLCSRSYYTLVTQYTSEVNESLYHIFRETVFVNGIFEEIYLFKNTKRPSQI